MAFEFKMREKESLTDSISNKNDQKHVFENLKEKQE